MSLLLYKHQHRSCQSEALLRVLCALSQSHSLSPRGGGNPLKLKRSISGSLGPRSSTPIGRRGAPPRSHWPSAAIPGRECPFSRQRRGRTPRGVIGQFRSLKSRQNGTSFAPGVSPRGISRELPGDVNFPGKPLLPTTMEDLLDWLTLE